ncbi:LppA family lipoprotein [Mycoplasma mycoides subsp. capri]|uniref:LppA family lipoprotein n=1 Tax=Mycoplasma mycoides TaxID=2102 RepID=UPI00223EA2FF|nr:LppA family lipoprotein [Mycoplasma mycoides]QVJ96488.1 LppA family lipoprotein [Mycoplasma mycoides subsp. capri]QVJ97375.1 LppA family lipoprotein [Mycoplasma mycoides subsp. capri]QVK00369.1 LppA family lipoprotein [Mycoplasma mycoides subsp. capri]QVK01254.1 LppA family lipoprotein [Mycoplasma mycoides subsp. capri]
MRKFNKLFLTILPISSISAFSVVSCTTNTKNNNQIPTIPNSIKPDNQKQPEQPSDKKPNSESNNHKQPDDKPTPGKPENKPDNSHNPKKPENNHSNNDQPQNDQPQGEPNDSMVSEIDFSDLNILKHEFSFQYITKYNKIDASTAWVSLKAEQKTIFKDFIFKDHKKILEKYQIEFDANHIPTIVNEKGTIDKIKVKFTRDNDSKILDFIFTGFKISAIKEENKSNKNEYVKQKEIISEKIKGLFPSLLAYMLLYIENNKPYEKLQEAGNVINFEELNNKNLKLFDENFAGFNKGIKELLFTYNEKYKTLYQDKIIAARYNDTNGELGLKVEISNTEDHPNKLSDPTITKEFTFKGFRHIDFKNPNDNVLNILLPQNNLKKIVTTGSLKLLVQQLSSHKQFNTKIKLSEATTIWSDLKNELLKNLNVDIQDRTNKIYKSQQTFSLSSSKKKEDNSSIVGLKNNMVLYPFLTTITKDSINQVYMTISNTNDKKELKLELEISLPIYSSALSDLTTHAGGDTTLKINISQTTQID